jgi:hypothetical protein
MLAYLGDSLRQLILGAIEDLAPVLHLDGVNGIHPARIKWLEVLHATLVATQTPPPMATSNSPTLTVLR